MYGYTSSKEDYRRRLRRIEGQIRGLQKMIDEDSLRRIQDLLTARLQKFGRREHLTVTWRRPETATAKPGS